MATTTRGYRYPTSADDVRPYEDIQFLASDIDADMANVDRGPVGQSAPAATDSTTSATYVSMAGTSSVSFTKTRAATRVRLSLTGGWSASAGGSAVCRFGMNINSVDVDCDRVILAASQIGVFNGWAYLTGVPAGTYTVTARWRREAGAGTAQRNATNDWLCIEVEEVV